MTLGWDDTGNTTVGGTDIRFGDQSIDVKAAGLLPGDEMTLSNGVTLGWTESGDTYVVPVTQPEPELTPEGPQV